MLKSILLSICLLCCISIANAQQATAKINNAIAVSQAATQAAKTEDNKQWQTITVDDGWYRVDMPTAPKATTIGDVLTDKFQINQLSSEHQGIAFIAGFGIIPVHRTIPQKDYNEMMDFSRTKLLALNNGELVTESAINIRDFQGREFVIAANNGKYIYRRYLVYNRLYILSVFMPNQLPTNVTTDMQMALAKKFFDSFALTKVEAPIVKGEIEQIALTQIVNTGAGFRIWLPANWSREDKSATSFAFSNQDPTQLGAEGRILLNVVTLERAQTLKQIADDVVQGNQFAPVIIDQGYTTIDNLKAWWIINGYTTDKSVDDLLIERIFVLNKNKEYLFTFTFPSAQYDDYHKLFQKMLNTVQWLDK